MPKRRRKLSNDYEKAIAKSKREVELILAKIYYIHEDDIREEYMVAFTDVKMKLDYVTSTYDSLGFTDDSDTLFKVYQKGLEKFINEYEI